MQIVKAWLEEPGLHCEILDEPNEEENADDDKEEEKEAKAEAETSADTAATTCRKGHFITSLKAFFYIMICGDGV